MKRIFQVSLAATLLIGGVSCGQQEDKTVDVETETIEVVEEVSEVGGSYKGLTLNKGAKWEVNEEMKEYPRNCETLVTQFVDSKSDDYQMLSEQLGLQTKKLISTCTMDGPSHDALHEWLEPNMSLVADLSKAQTKEEGNSIVMKLQQSYVDYNKYFN